MANHWLRQHEKRIEREFYSGTMMPYEEFQELRRKVIEQQYEKGYISEHEFKRLTENDER